MGLRRGALIAALTAITTTSAVAVAVIGPAAAAHGSAIAPPICTAPKDHQFALTLSRNILAALHGRRSVVGLAVSDPRLGLTCALHQTEHFDAASTIKATIISALLLKEHGPSHLTRAQRRLAWLMITESDNDAATALWNEVGMTSMQTFLNEAGMQHTELNYAWGLTLETAQDEMTLLHVLTSPNKVLSGASRRYVLYLMANVIASQRWGVPAGARARVHVSVKNGWLPDPKTEAWHINSLGAFSGKNIGYQIVVLTSGNASETYGIDTIEAAARVINKDIVKG